jgi:N4-gp56 family major capsid protein
MPSVINTYGDVSPRVGVRASRRFLARALPEILTQRWGQKETLRLNEGKVVKFRRFESLALTTAPLAEGVSPPGQRLRYTDVTLILEQYGDKVGITDQVADTHEDPVLQQSTDLCSEQASHSIEAISLNKLKGGTNVVYSGGVTARGSVIAGPTAGDISKCVRVLDRGLARPITKMVKASPDYSTTPVRASFVALAHTDLDWDLNQMTGFKPVVQYAQPGEALPNETGASGRVRFVLTQRLESWKAVGGSTATKLANGVAPSGATACDVYPILIMGQDWYGRANLQGMEAAKIMVLQPNQPRGGDELGQQGWVSWKLYYGIVILNDAYGLRYECACTANPS